MSGGSDGRITVSYPQHGLQSAAFSPPGNYPASLSLYFPSVEEAALLGEVDDTGRVMPRRGVFFISQPRTGPVIEGFEDCALGEFVRAQLEAISQNGEPPPSAMSMAWTPFSNWRNRNTPSVYGT